ncbi:hypothetical protein [Lentibacillus cibarius]|uniref:Uncharacterized protein n=1 Tax=Lentibacillus cibarius TaxID=2583219 RepID=A0A5S3QK41_9BACI|nr:hypothetical protein [Lentibacillus cibarius]TMN22097.1 hypothetical protein FFL34_08145 [Lentibacillus cibarius]
MFRGLKNLQKNPVAIYERMSKDRKIMIVIIGFLVVFSGIITFLNYQDKQEEERQYEVFLNHFYFSVDDSLGRIQHLIEEKPQNEELDKRIQSIRDELLQANTIIRNGSSFLNSEIIPTQFFRYSVYFLEGIDIKGTAKISPIAEDGALDDKEIKLLKTIAGYLAKAKQEMYSPKTGQENPELTIKELNQIIRKNIDKDIDKIYEDAF